MEENKSNSGSNKSKSPSPSPSPDAAANSAGPRKYVPPSQRPGYEGSSMAPSYVPATKPCQNKTKGVWQASRNPQKPAPPLPEEPAGDRWRCSLRKWQEPTPQRQAALEGSAGDHWRPSQRQWQEPTPQRQAALEGSAGDRWRPSQRQWQPPTPQMPRPAFFRTATQEPVPQELPQESPQEPPQEPAPQEPERTPEHQSQHSLDTWSYKSATPTAIASPVTSDATTLVGSDDEVSLIFTEDEDEDEESPASRAAPEEPEDPLQSLQQEPRLSDATRFANYITNHIAGDGADADNTSTCSSIYEDCTDSTVLVDASDCIIKTNTRIPRVCLYAPESTVWYGFSEELQGHYTGTLLSSVKLADLTSFTAVLEHSVSGSVELDQDYLKLEYTDCEIRDLLRRKHTANFAQTWVQQRWQCITSPDAPIYDEWIIESMTDDERFQAEASLAIVRHFYTSSMYVYYRYQASSTARKWTVKEHSSIDGAFCGDIPGQFYYAGPFKPRGMYKYPTVD